MTNGFLFSVPHERLHGTISILKQRPGLPTNVCKVRAVKDIMLLIAYRRTEDSNTLHLGPSSATHRIQAQAWRHHILPDSFHPLDEPDACACDVCQKVLGHHFSPCGSIVVGMMYRQHGPLPLCHWHLACGIVSSRYVQKASIAPMSVPPNMGLLVGHPQQHACVYAISDIHQGIHIIDAKADPQVRGWTRQELISLTAKQEQSAPFSAYLDSDQPALAWSHDGDLLAVVFARMGIVLSF